MRSRIFTTSEKAWAGMLSSIAAAEKSIYLEMYIFEDDIVGNSFLVELKNAVERGLRVIIILDMLGSRELDSGAVEQLRAAGVEVLFYSFFFRRTHRKILIIDERIAFVGGVNIKKHFAPWKDLQIRFVGKAVRHVVRSFARVYSECGGKDTSLVSKSKQSVFRRTKLWFVERGVGRRQEHLREYYEKRIDRANESIILVTPYLLPPRWLIASLHQAILRGVRVDLLLPNATDHRLANRLNRSFASFLVNLGVRCYFSSGVMNHAKAMIIDEKEGMIGSQNLDFLSFDFNIEAGIFFNDKKMVQDLLNIINDWKSGAELFDHNYKRFYWYDVVLAFMLRFSGLLPLWGKS
jgi:cardiolipin synthase